MAETLSFTMTCCSAMMPDTERHMACLQSIFDEYRVLLWQDMSLLPMVLVA